MTTIAYSTELKIATGWNNTAGYALITAEVDSDSIPFVLPMPIQARSRGRAKPRLSGRVDLISNDIAVWRFGVMTIKQWDYLYTTYYSANDSKVTVRTVTAAGGFSNYNAYIALPFDIPADLDATGIGLGSYKGNKANWIQNVNISFRLEGAAS